MPIYDMNQAGQIVSELRSLYDMNPAGEIVSKIGKVYDNDGTTDHLIYSAEQVLYDHGQQLVPWVTDWTNYGSVTWGSSNVILSASDYAGYDRGISIRPSERVSLTGYNTLNIDLVASFNSGTVNNRFLLVITDATGVRPGLGPDADATRLYRYEARSALDQVLSIPINSISGAHYIVLSAENGMTYAKPYANIRKVWLE